MKEIPTTFNFGDKKTCIWHKQLMHQYFSWCITAQQNIMQYKGNDKYGNPFALTFCCPHLFAGYYSHILDKWVSKAITDVPNQILNIWETLPVVSIG